MIYLPKSDYACYVVIDKDTIRAYRTMPYRPSISGQNVTIQYVDYYINSHYLEKQGTQNFSYNSTLPSCIDKNTITNEIYYRNDIDSILIVFTVIVLFGFGIPFYLMKKMFRRL